MAHQKDITLFIAFGCLTFCFFIIAFIVFVVRYQRRMFKKNIEIKVIEQFKQIQLFKASSEAEERQKEKISRNLHDQVSPLLTVLKQNLQKHRFNIINHKFDPESFKNDFEIIDQATESILACCYDLVPSYMLEYGLNRSLQSYFRNINSDEKLNASFDDLDFDPAKWLYSRQDELNIYRMCLEIINNILKHSFCSTLSLTINSLNNSHIFEFKHNGKGVTNEEMELFSEIKGGLGLKSLKARSLLLNARLDYLSTDSVSSVKLIIPAL